MKNLVLILSLIAIGGCAVEDEDVSMRLICKFNPNVLYEDTLTL